MAVLYEWDAATSSFRQTAVVLGDDGGKTAFLRILGYFDTPDALASAVPNPAAGDCYGVGKSAPYTFYIWDGVTLSWRENGSFQGAPGASIQSVERTSGTGEAGSIDTYTITMTDGSTAEFTVRNGTNGAAIVSIERTAGNGAPGTTDTYTITLSDGRTSTFSVANGKNGTVDTTGLLLASEKAAASGVATLDEDTKVTASQASAAVVNVSASTTLSSSHAGRFLSCTNTSGITITIPTGIAVGTEIEIYRGGAGTVTLSPASGVTVECKESTYGIADQYTSVVLKWRTDSIVVLEGNVG